MLAPESKVLPGQVSSRLFAGLKAGEVSVRDLHLHLHCSGPGYCCRCCLPRSLCVPPFILLCFQALPKGSVPVARFTKAQGGTMWRWGGVVLELRSFWLLRLVTGHAASLVRGRPLMLRGVCVCVSGGMWSNVLKVSQKSSSCSINVTLRLDMNLSVVLS